MPDLVDQEIQFTRRMAYLGSVVLIAALSLAGSCMKSNFDKNWAKENACNKAGGQLINLSSNTGTQGCYKVRTTYEPIEIPLEEFSH